MAPMVSCTRRRPSLRHRAGMTRRLARGRRPRRPGTSTCRLVSTEPEWTDVEVVRETAVSKDGTRVPLNIIKPKGLRLDGTNPTLLIGYGGYGVSLSPGFAGANRIWPDQGGVAVLANLRGGGEFGEEWHLAGNLTKKQNVFDDFIAAAEYLIAASYTSARAPRDRGRQQRRAADGRRAHAAPGPVQGGRLARRHLRHAARRALAQRRVQRHGVRHGEGRRRSSGRCTRTRPTTT